MKTKRRSIGLLRQALFDCFIALRDNDVTPEWRKRALALAQRALHDFDHGGCTCELGIHQRRRKTKFPIRAPMLTHAELVFLWGVVDDAITERKRKIRKMKRCYDRTLLTNGIALLRGIRRELSRS